MKLVRVGIEEVIGVRAKKKDLYKLIREFCESDMVAARVDYLSEEYNSVESARVSFQYFARKHNVNVRVVIRSNELYLVKEKA